MKLEYSADADALYLYFGRRRRSYRTEEIGWEPCLTLVDYGRDGTPIGVEIVGTQEGIDVSGLPKAREIATFLETHGFRVLALRS